MSTSLVAVFASLAVTQVPMVFAPVASGDEDLDVEALQGFLDGAVKAQVGAGRIAIVPSSEGVAVRPTVAVRGERIRVTFELRASDSRRDTVAFEYATEAYGPAGAARMVDAVIEHAERLSGVRAGEASAVAPSPDVEPAPQAEPAPRAEPPSAQALTESQARRLALQSEIEALETEIGARQRSAGVAEIQPGWATASDRQKALMRKRAGWREPAPVATTRAGRVFLSIVSGVALLAAGYGIPAALGTHSQDPARSWIFVPVIGPGLFAVSFRQDPCTYPPPQRVGDAHSWPSSLRILPTCPLENLSWAGEHVLAVAGGILAGAAQVVGLLCVIVPFVGPLDASMPNKPAVGMRLVPLLTGDARGLALEGRF